VVIQNLGTMRQSGCSCRRQNGVEIRPQRFQNLTGADGGTGNECADEAIKTIVFVPMHVKMVDCPLNCEAGRQFVSDPVHEVHNVLTDNVIYQHDPLLHCDTDNLQAPNEGEIYIFLLFPLQQIHKGIWYKTTMPGTTNRSNAGEVAGLGGK
jgi:hypothetical protein